MNPSRIVQVLAASLILSLPAGPVAADAEHWAEARAASCAELVDAYKETVVSERKVVAAMKEASNSATTTNVLGIAAMATLGIGFFTWNDNSSAEENLAELREDLNIITTVAAEKKCALPAAAGIK